MCFQLKEKATDTTASHQTTFLEQEYPHSAATLYSRRHLACPCKMLEIYKQAERKASIINLCHCKSFPKPTCVWCPDTMAPKELQENENNENDRRTGYANQRFECSTAAFSPQELVMRHFRVRVVSSRKSETALVGIHGRAELSASDENISDCNSAPPVIVKERPQHVVAAGAPRSCSHSSSDTHFRERLLESMSAPDAVAHFPGDASNEVVGAWKCNPFALSRAIRKKWRQKTIWNMLSRIDEIPEQVEGMLTQTASDLSMQVDGSVVQMQDRLREASPTGGEQVAETLEMLPRHFANSVEANLMDAAALLRQTVSSVTAELGAKDFEAEDIVQEIQVIPGKVRKVADEVISRAVNASVEELHQQLDEALGVLSASCAVREKELLQHLDQLPVVAEKRLTATGAVVDSAEDKIVDLMADLKSEFVPNHWLMEALLRAKASKGLSREGEAVEVVLSPREIRAENAERSERSERSQDAENGEALGEVADQKLEDSNAEEEADSQVRNPGSSWAATSASFGRFC